MEARHAGYVTLTLKTFTVIVCLAPKEVYFFLKTVSEIKLSVSFYLVVRILQSPTPILDPILIVLANPELRKMIKDRVIACLHKKAS